MIKELTAKINEEDEFCLLVDGPSGSGKTTLLLALVRALLDRQQVNFCFIPQYPNIISGSVEENINFFRPPVSPQILQKVMLEAGLKHIKPDFKLQSGGEPLSGGERQRLVLARSLLPSNSKLIIIDEGFSAMDDDRSKASMKKVISNFRQIIFTAHGPSQKSFATETLTIS